MIDYVISVEIYICPNSIDLGSSSTVAKYRIVKNIQLTRLGGNYKNYRHLETVIYRNGSRPMFLLRIISASFEQSFSEI